MVVALCATLSSVWALTAARASADGTVFGAAGQLVPFGSVGVELELGMGSPGAEGEVGRDLAIGVSPGLLYFVAPNLAVGISLDLGYADRELHPIPYTELAVGASLGAGVHIPLSEIVGFFPRVWLGGGFTHLEYDRFDVLDTPNFQDPIYQRERTRQTSGAYLGAHLVLPLLFQLAHATFISVGPSVRARWAVEYGERSLEFGFNVGVGRYF